MCNKQKNSHCLVKKFVTLCNSYQTSFHRKYVVYFGIPKLKVLVISFLVIASPIFFSCCHISKI